jgi:hypothetical protein
MSFVAVAVGTMAVTTLYSGYSAYQSGKQQSKLLKEQGELQLQEGLFEASRVRDEGRRFQQEQMMQYIGAGVEIKGTPLLVMAETVARAEEEAKATERRGYAQESFAAKQGSIAVNQGRAALIGSIGSAIGGGASTYRALK